MINIRNERGPATGPPGIRRIIRELCENLTNLTDSLGADSSALPVFRLLSAQPHTGLGCSCRQQAEPLPLRPRGHKAENIYSLTLQRSVC